MRYEDASLSGSFQDNRGPEARDDVDTLAAGSRGPATGNTITGAGTVTGSAGADMAAGAKVTAVEGAGGSDSSFSSGRLNVAGEHGTLSMRADGSYSYTPRAGTPENAKDIFTYTLADASGSSHRATLTIELGKTQMAISADAQRVVPGPDGVVVLPAGVDLSDIIVVGRDLVIMLPNGEQMVIVDGAVFVPQLVINDVEVPATNLAALLVDQEPQPAAGIPQSSGGNFGLPVGPLDPGVPLGDLIPPTELGYRPPEFEDVFIDEDREPDAGSVAVAFDEDDVVESGNPGGPGDDLAEGAPSSASGTLPASGGDGDLSFNVLLTGAPAGFTYVDGPGNSVLVQQGGVTVVTVSWDPATGEYTIANNTPIDHEAIQGENNIVFNFSYTVTDEDGDTAVGSISVNVDDDTPTVDVQAGSDANVVLTTNDAETDGDPTAEDSDSTSADFGGVFGGSAFAFGADGAGSTSTAYAVSAADGTNSGLTSHGQTVFLYTLASGVVVGSTSATEPASATAASVVFSVSVDNDGVVTLTQYQQVDHGVAETAPEYSDDTRSLADGAITLTRTDSITDGDGDTVSDSVGIGIGANLVFTDDGPSIDPTLNEIPQVEVDESLPAETATIALIGDYVRGDDPHLAGGLAIGTGSTTDAVVDANAVFGADGPATGGGVSYDLQVLNSASGLQTTEGVDIDLVELSNGVVVGVVEGTNTVAFAISIDPATGIVAVEQYLSLEHPDSPDNFDEGIFLKEGSLGVAVKATDFDGDSVTSDAVDISGVFRFDDDGPAVAPTLNADATVEVDESLPSGTPGIDTGTIVKGNDPDLAGGLAIGQATSGSAVVDAGAVFGADGPAAQGGIGYELSILSVDPGVTLTDGTTITLQSVDGVIVGVVDSGDFEGEAAFAIAIDPATGVVTVEQYLSLEHPLNPDTNEPLVLGEGSVGVVVTATDGDGDQISSDAVDVSGQITFLDDGPSVAPALNANSTVTVDESDPVDGATLDTGAIVKGDDPDLDGGLAIGRATSGVAVVDANAVFGADGAAAEGSLLYQLSITGTDAGVTLTDGTNITLQDVDGVIVGVVDSGDFGGQAAFAIAIDPATGVVTVEQYLSLEHPLNPDTDEPIQLGNNSVALIVTATDGDGDPIESDAVDISGQITFLDDGPSVDPSLSRAEGATVDESLPSGTAAIDTGTIVKGDDPDLDGGLAIGQASTGGSVLNAGAVFGADGPAANGGISYGLSVIDAASGLELTDGSPIELVQLANGNVVGVVEGGAFDGQAAFAFTIDPATGVVTVEQYLSLDHPANPDPNDLLQLAAGSLGATVTVTDGDGDPVTSGAVDISTKFTFLDDGPAADPALNADATVTVDETLPSSDPAISTGAIVKGNDPDLAGGLAIGQGNSGSAVVDAAAIFGADGPAVSDSVSYSLTILNAPSGVTLSDGSTITLQNEGGVLVGVVDNGAFAGQAAFAIAIDPTTGVVTVEQYLSLEHPDNPDPDDALGLGPNTVGVIVTATDGDGDPVISNAVNISGQITFLDDGPSVTPTLNTNATATVDETLPSNTPAIDTTGVTKGDDPDLASGIAIGQATTASAVINAGAVFGADGAAAGGGLSYSLSVINAASGLTLTDQSAINLVQLANGNVVGVVASGTFAGQAAFAFSIDPVTGKVTLEQYLSLDHPVNPDGNDPLQMLAGRLGATVTATDGDGDPVTSDAVDISQQFTFLDDGPTVNPAVSTLPGATVDESLPSSDPAIDTLTVIKGNDPDLAGGIAIGQSSTGGNVLNPSAVFGADGAAASNSLTYSLSVISAASGVTLTDGTAINLVQLANGNVVGVVQSGAFAGQAAFAFTINPSTGVVTVEQYLSLDHPTNPDFNEPVQLAQGSLGATVTATDGDGDPVTSSAVDISSKFTFLDDGPAASPDTDTVDATTGLATGNVITDAADGDAGDGDNGADTPGADGFGAITRLEGAETSDSNPAGGFTAIGEFGTLQMDAQGNYTYTRNLGEGGGDIDTFTYTYVDGDGDPVSSTLVISIPDATPRLPDPPQANLDDDVIPGLNGNPDGTGDDDPDTVGQNSTGGTLVGNGGDGDLDYLFSAAQGGLPTGFAIAAASDVNTLVITQVQNGSPVVVLTVELKNESGTYTVTQNAAIRHPDGSDENNIPNINVSVYAQDSDGSVSAPATLTINVDDDTPVVNVTKGDDASVTLVTQDSETDGNPTGQDTAVSEANFSVVFGLTQSAGADGTNAPATLNFTLATVNGTDSNLNSAGQDIFLFNIDGKVVGATTNDINAVAPGNTVFDVSVSGTGVVTLTQYSQIDHTTVDPSPTGTPFTDHVASLTDAAIKLTATASLTDRDNDAVSDSETVDIGANIRFQDDGPDISAALVDGVQIRIDETDGVVAAGGEVDPVGGNLGTVTVAAATYLTVGNVNVSADTPTGLSYSLVVGNGGVSGLLQSAANQPIFLYAQLDGSVIGSTSANAGGVNAGNTVFTASIDPVTGAVTLTQFQAIEHGNTASNDEDSIALAVNALQVRVTATDFDGDTDTANVDLGSIIRFEDDGPRPFTPDSVAALNGNSAPVIGNTYINYGSDTPGTAVFDITNGQPAKDSNGNNLLLNGQQLYLFGDGTGTIVATTAQDGTGTLGYTVTLNPNGTYTFDVNGTITNGTETVFDDFTDAKAGNVDFRGVGARTPGDVNEPETDDTDVLLSGRSDTAGNQGTVNTDSDSIGVDQQSVVPGAAVRIDLVKDLVVNAATNTGFSWDNHVETTHFEQTIPQVQAQATVSIVVWAINADEDQVLDNTPQTIEAGESLATITKVYMDPVGAGVEQSVDISLLAAGQTVAIGTTGSSVTKNANGSITISGIDPGDRYGFDTSNPFDAVVVENPTTNTRNFDLGIFSVGATAVASPIDQSFTVIATDADGDPVTSVINTTIVNTIAGSSTGNSDNNTINGSALADVIGGNAGDDIINGLAGNDFLYGGQGNDTLNGGADNDVLTGGTGADTLNGGAGVDTFVLSNAAITNGAGNVDTIADYAAGEVIDITSILSIPGVADPITGGFLRVTNTGLIQVDVDGGANGFVTVGTVNAAANYTVRYVDGGTATNVVVAPVAPPVALDLDGDGVEYVSAGDGVTLGGIQTAWVGNDDGVLVRDADGNGIVSASEVVFATSSSDLEGLKAYDSNGDSQLSSADASFGEFTVWQDANGNGLAEAGELNSLTTLGIVSLSLDSDGVSGSAAGGDVSIIGTGSYAKADGTLGILQDVIFRAASHTSQKLDQQAANSNTAVLAAAAAAVGLAAVPAAAEQASGTGEQPSPAGSDSVQSNAVVGKVEVESDNSQTADLLGSAASSAATDVGAEAASLGGDVGQDAGGHSVAEVANDNGDTDFSALLDGTETPGPAPAAAIAMPSTEGLNALIEAANEAGHAAGEARHNAVLGKVVADALNGGQAGPDIDALLAGLPGNTAANDADDSLAVASASAGAGSVPGWDSGHFASLPAPAAFTMESLALHHDAVPAA